MKKILLRAAALLLALVLAGCGTASPAETVPTEADKTDDNYRVFYEIFVGSFADSDGDGTGDLNGILQHLDYLNDGNLLSDTSLGVQGLWLTPIFASPSYHKYDATDYYRIDSDFGTEDDLRALLDACHARNVKVILDLVINHTARNHEWFQSFRQSHADANPDDPYYDYYSWYTGETLPAGITCEKIPGTADEYYECNFSPDMPELNYDNPAVREEMLNVAKYYLELGVDGFRFDAVKYLYYGETGRSAEFWKWYTDQLRAVKPEVYLVGECWSGESEILAYYPAMNCFNFSAAQAEGVIASAAKDQDINRFTGYMCAFQDRISQANPNGMMVCFLSNHDMDRSAGYLMLANHFPQMAANLYLLCGGSPFLYYGEEIGMKGVRGSANTDANRRLAMLWGDDSSPQDPEGSTYPSSKQTNGTVESQLAQEGSLLRYYCRLISIRNRYPAIPRGTYTQVNLGSAKCGGFLVEYEGSTLCILHNISTDIPFTVDLTDTDIPCRSILEVIGMGEASLEGTVLSLAPQTSLILGSAAP